MEQLNTEANSDIKEDDWFAELGDLEQKVEAFADAEGRLNEEILKGGGRVGTLSREVCLKSSILFFYLFEYVNRFTGIP